VTVRVRGLASSDREVWDGLWRRSLTFYEYELDAATTDQTFRRLVAGEEGFAAAHAGDRGCSSVYWAPQEGNASARRLYDEVATLTGFVRYEREP
jgi:hypothetical protein